MLEGKLCGMKFLQARPDRDPRYSLAVPELPIITVRSLGILPWGSGAPGGGTDCHEDHSADSSATGRDLRATTAGRRPADLPTALSRPLDRGGTDSRGGRHAVGRLDPPSRSMAPHLPQ